MDVADRIAAEVVTAERGGNNRDGYTVSVSVGRFLMPVWVAGETADGNLAAIRAAVADAVRRGVWEATTTGLALLPPGRLVEIEAAFRSLHHMMHKDVHTLLAHAPAHFLRLRGDAEDLLAHVRTLERLLGDDAERLAAAERVGWERAKAACVSAVQAAVGNEPSRIYILDAVQRVTP